MAKKVRQYELDFHSSTFRPDDKLEWLAHIYRAMVNSITVSVYGGRFANRSKREECYPFIPKDNLRNHFEQMSAVHEIIMSERLAKAKKSHVLDLPFDQQSIKFCDAGCGIGNIMVLAKCVGFKVFGVEYDERLVKWAKQICGPGWNKYGNYGGVTRGDLLKNARRWRKFDVVYYYCPLCDNALQAKFEIMLEDNLKVGAFIIAHLKKSHRIEKDSRFVRCGFLSADGKRFGYDGLVFRKVRRGPCPK